MDTAVQAGPYNVKDIEAAKEMFAAVDADGNGSIDAHELAARSRAVGHIPFIRLSALRA